jgi:hypothetical protein
MDEGFRQLEVTAGEKLFEHAAAALLRVED